jgi:hypothetical protein
VLTACPLLQLHHQIVVASYGAAHGWHQGITMGDDNALTRENFVGRIKERSDGSADFPRGD